MKENVMRSLTREEMKATFGGETWVAMAWKWLKNTYSLKLQVILIVESKVELA